MYQKDKSIVNGKKVLIYTDGGCERNPGGRGGYGVVIIYEDGSEKSLSGGYRATTNNRMELMAAIKALEVLPDGCDVVLKSDSKYLVETMSGRFSRGKNFDLWNILDNEAKRQNRIKWEWVRGHNGNRYNELCDQLATEGMAIKSLETDKGYKGKISIPAQNKISQLSMNIPERDEKYIYSPKTAEDEAKEKGCNTECIKAIRKFYKTDQHILEDYFSVKSGGLDSYSKLGETELNKIIGEKDADAISEVFSDPKDRKVAMRWVARGLLMNDAIRKVLVDKEALSIEYGINKKQGNQKF